MYIVATVEAVSAPWEGAQAWKIDRSMDERGGRYPMPAEGPWVGEPDKIQWVDDTTDLDCLMLRNHFGNWCGYVGVPAGHPTYGISYSECLEGCSEDAYCYEHSLGAKVSVHGGLTFGDKCSNEGEDGQPSAGICHVPLPGRPHDVFWHGFDCGHAGDFAPGMWSMEMTVMPDLLAKYGKTKPYDHEAAMKGDWMTEKYRTMAYVRAEVTDLASQLVRL